MDPDGRVVSYHLTHFLHFYCQDRSILWYTYGLRARRGRDLMMGSLPSSSTVSQQLSARNDAILENAWQVEPTAC